MPSGKDGELWGKVLNECGQAGPGGEAGLLGRGDTASDFGNGTS